MRNRRIAAYSIDLLIFLLVSFLVMFVFQGIADNIVRFLLNALGLVLVYGLVFGLLSTYLRGSIGKKIMDLKVMPTVGIMTPVRLLVRDVVLKYLITLPFVIGFMSFIRAAFPDQTGIPTSGTGPLLTGLLITSVLGLGLAGVNGYVYLKEKRWLVDKLLDTNVENDIPTAVEYQDLRAFLEKSEG